MAIEFEVSEAMRARPGEVMAALLDLERAHLWMPGLVRMEQLTQGPLAVGSEWRETRKMFGRKATEQFTLTAIERPHRLDVAVDGTKGSSGRGEYLFSYALEPADAGCVVRLSGEIRGLPAVMGWLGKLLVGPYRKACSRDLAALKAHLESGKSEQGGHPVSGLRAQR